MKNKILLAVYILIFIGYINSYSQDWAAGIRLGDPSGITLKKYLKNNAVELNIGRTQVFSNSKIYNKKFNDWYIDENFAYYDFEYLSHKLSTPLSFQLHYLIHNNINNVEDINTSGLSWYYGFGAQFRFQTYTFDYRYRLENNNRWFYTTGESVTDYDIGPDAIVGMEYTLKKTPISLFLDITLFMELLNNPFKFWLQGGIGVRYMF